MRKSWRPGKIIVSGYELMGGLLDKCNCLSYSMDRCGFQLPSVWKIIMIYGIWWRNVGPTDLLIMGFCFCGCWAWLLYSARMSGRWDFVFLEWRTVRLSALQQTWVPILTKFLFLGLISFIGFQGMYVPASRSLLE